MEHVTTIGFWVSIVGFFIGWLGNREKTGLALVAIGIMIMMIPTM
ncbi:MAG: hypothetical protein WAX80_02150 [Minisyncoccia bacterium]